MVTACPLPSMVVFAEIMMLVVRVMVPLQLKVTVPRQSARSSDGFVADADDASSLRGRCWQGKCQDNEEDNKMFGSHVLYSPSPPGN